MFIFLCIFLFVKDVRAMFGFKAMRLYYFLTNLKKIFEYFDL